MKYNISDDIKYLLKLLNKYKVNYLICGGHAVAFYGYIRMTMDFDILIKPTKHNSLKMMKVLKDFGFGDLNIPQEAFIKEGTAITLGVQPNQIDLLTSISKKSTLDIFKRYKKGKIDNIEVKFVSFKDLIIAKKAAKRLKDLVDVKELEKIKKTKL